MKTLQLNIGYEPINLISWKKAIVKVFKGKAEILDEQDSPLRSCYINGKKPAVIRLFQYHKNYNMVKLNRENIYVRDQYTCQYCGNIFSAPELTLDHVMPESRGGLFSWKNLVTCCATCNNKKGSQTPQEAEMPLLREPFRPSWMPDVLIKSIKMGEVPKQWGRWISWVQRSNE